MLLFAVVLYLIITIAVGIGSSKLVKTSSDYVSAGRRLPFFLNTAALFALWFGSETIFGASSEFAEHGLSGVIEDPFGGFLCLVIFALVFARPLYRMNLLTLGDLFRNYFGPKVEMISSLFMALTFIGYIAAQLVALGILMHLVSDWDYSFCILLSAFIVAAYTMAGGMWAISITDFIQSILIVAGLTAVALTITADAGGMDNILEKAPPDTFRFFPEKTLSGWINWIAAWMTLGLGSLASQDIFQRINAAKSEKVAVYSTLSGAGLYLILSALPLYIALAARVLYGNELAELDLQFALPKMVMKHSGVGIQILFFGAFLSAIFSTCSGAILAPASILSENLIKPLLKKDLTEKQFLLTLRSTVAGVTVIATLMALSRNNIYELVAESSILGLTTLLTPMVFAVFKLRASAAGAVLSMCCGISGWVLFEFFLNTGIPALMPGFLFSILGMVLGTRFWPPTDIFLDKK